MGRGRGRGRGRPSKKPEVDTIQPVKRVKREPKQDETVVNNEETETRVPLKEIEIIKEWKYILDEETEFFKYPDLPDLDDTVINKYLTNKSTKVSKIYECPYCKRIFTYTLSFKNHLYTCTDSPHCEYAIICAFKDCKFKSAKKADVVSHYRLDHLNEKQHGRKTNNSQNSSRLDNSVVKARYSNVDYLYINTKDYVFVVDYYGHIQNTYKRLELIDEHFKKQEYAKYSLKPFQNDKPLLFKPYQSNSTIELKCFDLYQTKNYQIFNLCSQITALDWAYISDSSQYLAITTLPHSELLKEFSSNDLLTYEIKKTYTNSNFIYFYRFNKNETHIKLNTSNFYAILNRNIGHVYCLKWRPDCGACSNINNKFIGYLLATSSNGLGYVYAIENNFHNSDSNSIEIYEPQIEIRLKCDFNYYGQCTTGDWCQLNGAVHIALGYSNGCINLFHLNKLFYFNKSSSNENFIDILPYKCINAHLTVLRTLKWSKTNFNILASGSLFSREIKVWNTINDDENLLEHEALVTEIAFSMHCDDLFFGKEALLKGDNRLYTLDLYYSPFNMDKEQQRTHSSYFCTYTTITSIDLSDLYNKCILCDSEGTIILNRADEPSKWVHKNKSIIYSFAQVAKFMIENRNNDDTNDDGSVVNENKYNVCFEQLKESQILKLDLGLIKTIRWNQNFTYENVYAVGSVSGFVYIHQLEFLDHIRNMNA